MTNTQQDQAVGYAGQMIVYAIQNYRQEVVNLLAENGISVAPDAENKTLHIMVLQAMISSESFKKSLSALLHNIALNSGGNGSNYGNYAGCYFNQTGTCATCCSPSYLGQVLTPTTVQSLLSSGLTILSSQLATQGNAGIAKTVNTPPPPPPVKTFPWGAVLAVVAIVGVGGFIFYKVRHKK